MRMKRAFKAMLAATACVCMLATPISIHAAEPMDGQIIEGSLLTHDDNVETTKLFEWKFNNPESEVATIGTYYATGHSGISKQSSKSIYVTANGDSIKLKPISVHYFNYNLIRLKNSMSS